MKPMTLRWILVGLSAALAVAVLLTGHVVIGLLISAMVCVRIALLFSMRRRRNELRDRFGRGPGVRL
jgi:hypothetical protein